MLLPIKKSELYSSLWSSCDELRGGMDASQYKDYVLVLLFIKYISDKYAGVPYAPITVPAGASFKDMVALKGKPSIGDDINKKIIGPLANANKLSDMPDFNDATKILGIREARTTSNTTVYDPTCGSGSLLLKVADEARAKVTLYGQEKDAATSGLARMNMILYDNPSATIIQGNTLADPKYKDGDTLKMFDYVVANPPFSDKRWGTGFNPLNDPFDRFKHFGVPPGKQGDYAYLLHIIRLAGEKGACILPHDVLFPGNSEAGIRRNLNRNAGQQTS